jgi:hypothetical protein
VLMVLPQYDELTSEDDDGAPPFAREYDEEESREAYQRAAYREAIAHFLPLPRTSCLLCRSYQKAQLDADNRAMARLSARANIREAIAILPANHVIITRDFVNHSRFPDERRYSADYDQAAAVYDSDGVEEVD